MARVHLVRVRFSAKSFLEEVGLAGGVILVLHLVPWICLARSCGRCGRARCAHALAGWNDGRRSLKRGGESVESYELFVETGGEDSLGVKEAEKCAEAGIFGRAGCLGGN